MDDRPLALKIRDTVFKIIFMLLANIYMLLSVIRNILSYGKEYFEGPKWYPRPKFLTDSKFGEHKIAHLKGINLHYVESGDANKPLMLLVHGFPEFWYSWHHQIEEFQKDYRVVAIDMRGYGQSDKPQDVEPYKMDYLVDDLKQLMEHLGVKRCVLVGHDWGGAVVWSFAATHPTLLDFLIVMNCPHGRAFQDVVKKSIEQVLRSWYMFYFQMPYFPEWCAQRLDLKMIGDCFTDSKMGLKKQKLTPAELDAYKANMVQPGALTAAINFYRAVFRYPRLSHNIEVPTLLIWGTEDGALTNELAEATKRYCSDLTLKYMDGASHWVQQDMPSEVNVAMREFLAQERKREE